MTPSPQSNVVWLEGVVRPIPLGNATCNYTISTIPRCLKKYICFCSGGSSGWGVPRTGGPGHVPHRPHGKGPATRCDWLAGRHPIASQRSKSYRVASYLSELECLGNGSIVRSRNYNMFYLEPISSAEWERLTNQSAALLAASSRGHSVTFKMADGTGPANVTRHLFLR